MPPALRFVVPPQSAGRSVLAFLGESGRLPPAEVQAILRAGGVFVNRRRIKAAEAPLAGGDRVDVHPSSFPAAPPVRLLHVDADLVVVDKPPFLPVDATRASDTHTLHFAVEAQLGAPHTLKTVHRLDREVSGAVVFARTPTAARLLSQQMRTHEAGRRYLAVTHGCPPGALTLRHLLRPDGRGGSATFPADGPPDPEARLAVTHVTPLVSTGDHGLLEIHLETGRLHQIRAQLAAAGWPLVGDTRYGPRGRSAFPRPALHAAALTFSHPLTGATFTVEAPVPADLRDLLNTLNLSTDTPRAPTR